MGSRRRHLFVLLFVLGLVVASGIVIAQKETKLGLDLQGGLELVYEGQATGENTEVSGEDIEDSISIIEKRVNELGVSEPEVARIGDKNISVALAGVTDTERAAEQVGTTAQLYFYDWEPNLIGPEKVIGGRPGQQPPKAALNASKKRWEEAGRNVKSFENEQLIYAGAYPNAYTAAQLAADLDALIAAYRFDPKELRQFMRQLFRKEYGRELEDARTALAAQPRTASSFGEITTPMGTPYEGKIASEAQLEAMEGRASTEARGSVVPPTHDSKLGKRGFWASLLKRKK